MSAEGYRGSPEQGPTAKFSVEKVDHELVKPRIIDREVRQQILLSDYGVLEYLGTKKRDVGRTIRIGLKPVRDSDESAQERFTIDPDAVYQLGEREIYLRGSIMPRGNHPPRIRFGIQAPPTTTEIQIIKGKSTDGDKE